MHEEYRHKSYTKCLGGGVTRFQVDMQQEKGQTSKENKKNEGS